MAHTNDNAPGAGSGVESLYRWWLGALPNLFAGTAPSGIAADATDGGGTPPFPVETMIQALGLAQRGLGSLYEAALGALVAAQPGEQARVFEQLVADQASGLADRLVSFGQAFSGHPNLAELNARLTGSPLTGLGEALKPLSVNFDRAYGGLADAFGLAPWREIEEAMRDVALAVAAQRQAQLEYLEVVAGALHKGAELLATRLAGMGQRGESVESMLGLVRLWARSTDEAMHAAMQSPRALEATAKLLRASARARKQQQRVVAIASEALNVPTRAEVDEAYREIQELKRELRRLRKAAALPPGVLSPDAATGSSALPRRAGAGGARAGAARKRATKATPARKAGRKGAAK